MLIEFTQFSYSDSDIVSNVHVNPQGVSSIKETEARKTGRFYNKVAIINFTDGSSVTVHDDNRDCSARLNGKGEN